MESPQRTGLRSLQHTVMERHFVGTKRLSASNQLRPTLVCCVPPVGPQACSREYFIVMVSEAWPSNSWTLLTSTLFMTR